MGGVKNRKKALEILVTAAILLTAMIAANLIQNQNQNTYPLINSYLQGVSQGYPTVILPKLDISNDITFSQNYSETINVLADNIVIDGNGYFVLGPGSGSGFNLTGRINVTIKNVIVTGWQYSFYLYNSSNNNLWGNTANNNTYQGFYLYNSSNNNLSGNTANNNRYDGFKLYQNSNGNTLSGNTAIKNGNYGFFLQNSSNGNTLSGNTANNNGYGFRLEGSSYNNLSDNTANNNYVGFYLSFYLYQNSNNNTLSGNIAANNNGHGFYLSSSSYNNLSGNTVTNNNYGRGFYLSSSSYNNLSGNTVTNNYYSHCFYLENSSNNIIMCNTVVCLSGYDFYIDYRSYNNIFENNTVIITNLFVLVGGLYVSLQGEQARSNVLMVDLLVIVVFISSFFIYYGRKKGFAAKKGVPEEKIPPAPRGEQRQVTVPKRVSVPEKLPVPWGEPQPVPVPKRVKPHKPKLPLGDLEAERAALKELISTINVRFDAGKLTPAQYVETYAKYRARLASVEKKLGQFVSPVPASGKQGCLFCGSEIPGDTKFCPTCGGARLKCSVCQMSIVTKNRYAKCPQCGVLSHRNHLLKWIREKGYCPNCMERLKETEII